MSEQEQGKVEFNEEQGDAFPNQVVVGNQTPKLVELVLKTGVVDDTKQATYVLLGFVVITAILTLVVFFIFNERNSAELQAPPGYIIISPPDAPPYLERISQ